MSSLRSIFVVITAVAAASAAWSGPATAETIFGALSKAYENNPDLNAARAGLRATDEGVAIAKSGYRPQIYGSASVARTRSNSSIFGVAGTPPAPFSQNTANTSDTASVGVTFTQNLFDGFQTRNNVRAAEATVYGGRQNLRNTEMSILLSAAQIYANVIRDQQIVIYRQQNLEFLREQRNAAQARLDVGEGTRTDVALAQAQLESARAALLAAQAQLKSSQAVYVQIIGAAPSSLRTPSPYTKHMPRSSTSAVQIGLREHPAILSAQYTVDAAAFNVKSLEGTLLPSVSLNGSVVYSSNTNTASTSSYGALRNTDASVSANVNVPIYQGGLASAQVRQAKETMGQAQILVDSARREVEQFIVTYWADFQAAKASISANKAQVEAAQLALKGVVEERKVGQSTQLDVLETQSNVLTAQESLAQSQRDAVVASYALMSAIGRLTVGNLGLKVANYQPSKHYDAVKDKWFGLRTVDGR